MWRRGARPLRGPGLRNPPYLPHRFRARVVRRAGVNSTHSGPAVCKQDDDDNAEYGRQTGFRPFEVPDDPGRMHRYIHRIYPGRPSGSGSGEPVVYGWFGAVTRSAASCFARARCNSAGVTPGNPLTEARIGSTTYTFHASGEATHVQYRVTGLWCASQTPCLRGGHAQALPA